MLLLSLGVALATSAFLSQTFQLAVTQPWFGAQNVNVTAPSWLRRGLPVASQTISRVRNSERMFLQTSRCNAYQGHHTISLKSRTKPGSTSSPDKLVGDDKTSLSCP